VLPDSKILVLDTKPYDMWKKLDSFYGRALDAVTLCAFNSFIESVYQHAVASRCKVNPSFVDAATRLWQDAFNSAEHGGSDFIRSWMRCNPPMLEKIQAYNQSPYFSEVDRRAGMRPLVFPPDREAVPVDVPVPQVSEPKMTMEEIDKLRAVANAALEKKRAAHKEMCRERCRCCVVRWTEAKIEYRDAVRAVDLALGEYHAKKAVAECKPPEHHGWIPLKHGDSIVWLTSDLKPTHRKGKVERLGADWCGAREEGLNALFHVSFMYVVEINGHPVDYNNRAR
jgi:hypothetical protein